MQLFSRAVHDQYNTNWLTGVGGITFQLIGTMTIAPLLVLIGKSAVVFVVRLAEWTGSPYSFWELDAGLSPALVALLGGGALAFLFRKPNRGGAALSSSKGAAHRVGAARRKVSIPMRSTYSVKRLLALVCLVIAILLVIEFILAEGIVYPQIRDLPFLRSMRVNSRWTSAFIFPLALVGAVIFDKWTQNWKSKQKTLAVFLLLNGIALAGMWAYYLIPMKYQVRNFGVGYPLTAYEKIQREGETFVMDRIIPDINDWEVFQASASGLRPFETLFGDIETFRTNLHEGSVYDIS